MGSSWTEIEETEQSQGRWKGKTPAWPLGCGIVRAPDRAQPGGSLLASGQSFESPSPRDLVSFPCTVTQANSGSAGRGFLTCWRHKRFLLPRNTQTQEVLLLISESTPCKFSPTSPCGVGRRLPPRRRPQPGLGSWGAERRS